MFAKVLGLGDFACVILLLFAAAFPAAWIASAAGYLIVKGGFFSMLGDLASMMDIASGAYILLVAFGISYPLISAIVLLFLFQKAAMTLLQ